MKTEPEPLAPLSAEVNLDAIEARLADYFQMYRRTEEPFVLEQDDWGVTLSEAGGGIMAGHEECSVDDPYWLLLRDVPPGLLRRLVAMARSADENVLAAYRQCQAWHVQGHSRSTAWCSECGQYEKMIAALAAPTDTATDAGARDR